MKHLLICLILSLSAFSARAESLKIVADVTPVAAIVAGIVSKDQEVKTLIPPNSSPHDFTLRPSDIQALRDAALILWSGEDTTPTLEKLLTSPAFADKTIDLSSLKGVFQLPLRETEVQENDENQDHFDPHLWLSPQNALIWVDVLTAELARLDPSHAPDLQDRSRALRADIDSVVAEAQTTFAKTPKRAFIQYHDAFAYFETTFGLEPIGVATLDDEENASLGKIAKLRDIATAEPSICVMTSHPSQSRAARNLLVAKDSYLISAEPLRAESYPDLLSALSDSFRACLY